jgi:hypothetical protein
MTAMQEYGYAQLANAHTLTEYEAIARRRFTIVSMEAIPSFYKKVEVDCENLYRVASLMAYGSGWACPRDIEHFTRITYGTVTKAMGYPACDVDVRIEALLPHDTFLRDEAAAPQIHVPYSFEQKYLRVSATRRLIRNEEYQVFTLDAWGAEVATEEPELARLLGELIANHFAPKHYIGTFDGKPEFLEAQSTGRILRRIEDPWLSLAQLKRSDSPRLCPACGKVVERSVGEKGGKPPIACSKGHIDKYNNEKKRLLKLHDPDRKAAMQDKDEREAKAREMRWRGESNERPYKFPGIADMEEYLKEAPNAKPFENVVTGFLKGAERP